MSDDRDRSERELAIVRQFNGTRLEELQGAIAQHRQETAALLGEVDALVDADLLEAMDASVPSAGPRLAVQSLGPGPESDRPGPTWSDLVRTAQTDLAARGIAPANSLRALLSPDEDARVLHHLARPIYDRIPWDRWDLLVAFGAGIAGAATDILLATPGHFGHQAMADKSHWLGRWMERVHGCAPDSAPVDYQGPHFGGGYHRGRTTGHDLLRPLEGWRQFKDGVFRGSYFKDGVKHVIETDRNQHGTPYRSMSWSDAIVAWLIHNACDFFSSTSLPIPGTSWLWESPNRDVRVFVERELYQQGIHLRHVTLQAAAALVVEVGIRAYVAIRYRQSAAPAGAVEQKRAELLALGHTLTVAVNTGKVIVTKDPTMLNVPALLALLRSVLGLAILEHERTSFVNVISRNVAELRDAQARIEAVLAERIPQPLLLE